MALDETPELPAATARLMRDAPYVGALLRAANQLTRQRSFEILTRRGFADLNPALLGAFTYPPPEGARPTDLAARANTTKQAMNYLLSQLEALGYMERRAAAKSGRRLVYLTPRGWQVYDAIWTAQRQLEDEWAVQLGRARYEDFMAALREVSAPAGDAAGETRKVRLRRPR